MRRGEATPFVAATREGRPLCFFFDPNALAQGEAPRAFLAYAAADALTTFATSPTEGAHTLELPAVPADYAPNHPLDDVLTVAWREAGGSNGIFGVMGIRNALAAAAERAPDMGLTMGEARRWVVLAAAASDFRGCDALVSDDPRVHELAPRRARVLTTADAASLIGLQARLRGDFGLGPDIGPFSRWLFYWVLARELLPAGWRWFTACLESGRAGGDPTLGDLGGSAIARLDSALRARDRFHGEAKQPHSGSRADEALFYFETTLLYLSAVFDVAARVASTVYGIENRNRASWRSDAWLAQLNRHDPDLARLMAPETAGRDALEALQLLRNTVHGEALRNVEHQSGGEPPRSLLEVPERELERLAPVLERRGGTERWGLTARGGGRSYIDPEPYLEALMPDAARSVDAVLHATDVTRLPGVAGVDLGGPPPNVPSRPTVRDRDPFSFEFRRRIRVLAGFGEIDA